MRKLKRDISSVIINNLTWEGNPDIWECSHLETGGKLLDNWGTSIGDNTKRCGVNYYEKA